MTEPRPIRVTDREGRERMVGQDAADLILLIVTHCGAINRGEIVSVEFHAGPTHWQPKVTWRLPKVPRWQGGSR